jgi:hypothetical protein
MESRTSSEQARVTRGGRFRRLCAFVKVSVFSSSGFSSSVFSSIAVTAVELACFIIAIGVTHGITNPVSGRAACGQALIPDRGLAVAAIKFACNVVATVVTVVVTQPVERGAAGE